MAGTKPLRFKVLLQRLQLLGVHTAFHYPSTGDLVLMNTNTKRITFPYAGRLHTIPDYRGDELISAREIGKILQHLDVDQAAFWSVVEHEEAIASPSPPSPPVPPEK